MDKFITDEKTSCSTLFEWKMNSTDKSVKLLA